MDNTKSRGTVWRKRFFYVVITVVLLNAIAIALDVDPRKIDFGKFFTRASWQHPDRVIESLSIQSGYQVADIGAGDGYFTFALADAVGPSGRVYAVDVDEKTVRTLEKKVEERGYSNIVVVLGEYDDPLLPDGQIDIVFLCNTYHHIEGRTAYFDRLRTDLKEDGRVAIVDLKGSPFIKLIGHDEHSTAMESMQKEMRDAHYLEEQVFDFLPIQNFLIFRHSR
jgi:ubiquinone/menaquinone biosynthesis C-methylase UbiE